MSRYIDADDAIYRLEKMSYFDSQPRAIRRAGKYLDTFADDEPADVEEVRHGEWVPVEQLLKNWSTGERTKITAGYYCSECGHEEKVKYRYCNCGAKMDKEEEDAKEVH